MLCIGSDLKEQVTGNYDERKIYHGKLKFHISYLYMDAMLIPR
jgi:hypothetical protein